MGRIVSPNPVKLVAGFIFKEDPSFQKAKKELLRKFGKIDFESETLDFCLTDYYEKEFGRGLKRKFLSFNKLIAPERLPDIKITTNRLEEKLARNKQRTINIDPGYLDLAKLVLASTKDYKHRIYLAKGIFAEITLFFQNKSFSPWEWTYPDYRTTEYISIFNNIRALYMKQTGDLVA
jgi:hypothetical protein